jgi:hypothetical protein
MHLLIYYAFNLFKIMRKRENRMAEEIPHFAVLHSVRIFD